VCLRPRLVLVPEPQHQQLLLLQWQLRHDHVPLQPAGLRALAAAPPERSGALPGDHRKGHPGVRAVRPYRQPPRGQTQTTVTQSPWQQHLVVPLVHQH
jgi:hypothetical protein